MGGGILAEIDINPLTFVKKRDLIHINLLTLLIRYDILFSVGLFILTFSPANFQKAYCQGCFTLTFCALGLLLTTVFSNNL